MLRATGSVVKTPVVHFPECKDGNTYFRLGQTEPMGQSLNLMLIWQIQHTTEIEFKRLLCSAFHAFDANSGCKQESVKLSTALRIRYTKTILLTNQSRNRPSCPDHHRLCNQDIEATLLVRFQYQDFCLPLPAWIHTLFQFVWTIAKHYWPSWWL